VVYLNSSFNNSTGEENMRTNVTTKQGKASISLADANDFVLYEVVKPCNESGLHVGNILFKYGTDYFVVTNEDDEVARFYFTDDEHLELIRVYSFQSGDSFTVSFEE
jgi:hypothetical protein